MCFCLHQPSGNHGYSLTMWSVQYMFCVFCFAGIGIVENIQRVDLWPKFSCGIVAPVTWHFVAACLKRWYGVDLNIDFSVFHFHNRRVCCELASDWFIFVCVVWSLRSIVTIIIIGVCVCVCVCVCVVFCCWCCCCLRMQTELPPDLLVQIWDSARDKHESEQLVRAGLIFLLICATRSFTYWCDGIVG